MWNIKTNEANMLQRCERREIMKNRKATCGRRWNKLIEMKTGKFGKMPHEDIILTRRRNSGTITNDKLDEVVEWKTATIAQLEEIINSHSVVT